VKPEKNRKIELDPTKITIWKEYFCRFDEGRKDKKDQVPQTKQLQFHEENLTSTIQIDSCQSEIDVEIEEIKK
jgi:hypothetical protein